MDKPTREEFIRDVMTTALEGGISYWATVKGMVMVEGYPEIFQVREHGVMDAAWSTVDFSRIELGIARIISGEMEICKEIRDAVTIASRDNDACNIDVDGADCIVQAAVFGKLVFG